MLFRSQPASRRPPVPLDARVARHSRARRQSGGVSGAHQARDVPGPGVLLHAERGGHRAAERGDTGGLRLCRPFGGRRHLRRGQGEWSHGAATRAAAKRRPGRSEEHTSEIQSLMRNTYAVFCLKKKKKTILELTES